jgi:hypothetical protein
MRAALPLALLAFALAPLPAVDATHCPGVVVTDDGAHSVTHTPGGDVVVNGAGVTVSCFDVVAGAYETYSLISSSCSVTRITDDGAHGVTESGGTVYVNGAGVKHTCLVTVIVPENVYLP